MLFIISVHSVFKTNAPLIFFEAIKRSGIFKTSVSVPIGKPQRYFTIIAIPEIPPGAISAPSAKEYIPTENKNEPII